MLSVQSETLRLRRTIVAESWRGGPTRGLRLWSYSSLHCTVQWSVQSVHHLNLPKSPTNSPAFIINRVRDSTWCLSVCPSNDSLESSEISNSRKGLLHNWIQLQILHWTSTYLEYLFPNTSFPKPQQMQGRLIRHNKWPLYRTLHLILSAWRASICEQTGLVFVSFVNHF